MKPARITPTLAAAALLALAGVPLTGCRGDRSDDPPHQFFPDLDDQPKWRPQTKSDFFADGRTMRQPVAGTVPFGRVSFVSKADWAAATNAEKAGFLKDNDLVYLGKNPDGTFVERIPIPVTRELIERGRNRFNIYCVACHGYLGDGKGMVGQSWSYTLPNFADEKYKKPDATDPKLEIWKDGYVFSTARNGVTKVDGQKMPGYGHALDEHDAWAVVAYVRTLQAARGGSIDEVPEAERDVIKRQRETELTKILAAEKAEAERKAAADQAEAQKKAAAAANAPGGAPSDTKSGDKK